MDILLCSIPDAAKALGIGRSKLYTMLGEHLLETVSIGSRRLVKVESIRRLVEQSASGGTA